MGKWPISKRSNHGNAFIQDFERWQWKWRLWPPMRIYMMHHSKELNIWRSTSQWKWTEIRSMFCFVYIIVKNLDVEQRLFWPRSSYVQRYVHIQHHMMHEHSYQSSWKWILWILIQIKQKHKSHFHSFLFRCPSPKVHLFRIVQCAWPCWRSLDSHLHVIAYHKSLINAFPFIPIHFSMMFHFQIFDFSIWSMHSKFQMIHSTRHNPMPSYSRFLMYI